MCVTQLDLSEIGVTRNQTSQHSVWISEVESDLKSMKALTDSTINASTNNTNNIQELVTSIKDLTAADGLE
jgi:DNA-binding transcriptional regulator YbjK